MMSIVLAAHQVAAYLADTINTTPITPPAADKMLRVIGWLSWAAMTAGVAGIVYAGGKFAWERWHGGAMESPKIVLGALIGGVLITSAGAIMNGVVS